MYNSFSEMKPGQLFEIDKIAFMTDAAMAEARNFIESIAKKAASSASGDSQLINLCVRLILRMGIVRENPEDLLIADRLLNIENISKVVDLREEIKIILSMTKTSQKKDENQTE